MLHLFRSAAFPLGMVKVSHQSHVTELDRTVVPFDYTVYTSIYCAESFKSLLDYLRELAGAVPGTWRSFKPERTTDHFPWK